MPRLAYQRRDASPEGELSVLVKIYDLAIQKRQESEKGTRPGAPDDAKEIKNVRAKTIIPEHP
jgi:hypothetical protein